MATNPTLITTPFAQSGDKTTPPNTNTPSDGRFSQTLGFPPVTAIPLGSGGKAPKREDFNGAFNMLSNIVFYAQKGWIFQWDNSQSYYAGCIVRYNGDLYACTSDVTSTSSRLSSTSSSTFDFPATARVNFEKKLCFVFSNPWSSVSFFCLEKKFKNPISMLLFCAKVAKKADLISNYNKKCCPIV